MWWSERKLAYRKPDTREDHEENKGGKALKGVLVNTLDAVEVEAVLAIRGIGIHPRVLDPILLASAAHIHPEPQNKDRAEEEGEDHPRKVCRKSHVSHGFVLFF